MSTLPMPLLWMFDSSCPMLWTFARMGIINGITDGIWRPIKLHQPRLWFITGGYLVKRSFIPAAARARGQSNDLNREILASNLFNCHKEVINAPPVPSISRCIHIVYRHKNVWEYQWSNFIYNCMSTFLHYVRCKDALLDCSAPGGERCESLTWVDEIISKEMPCNLEKYQFFTCSAIILY